MSKKKSCYNCRFLIEALAHCPHKREGLPAPFKVCNDHEPEREHPKEGEYGGK